PGNEGRGIAWIMVELLVDRLHHRVGYVQAGQVEQLEGPHAEARAVAQDAVDLLYRGHAFAEHAQGFGTEGAPGMVDQEAGGVRGDRREVSGLLRQLHQTLDVTLVGTRTADHLDDLHQRHGVEEVETGHPLGAAAAGGDAGYRQGGGVGCSRQPSLTMASRSANSFCLTSRISTMASITRSQSFRSVSAAAGCMRAQVASNSASLSLPLAS